jgi:hypothetical protein
MTRGGEGVSAYRPRACLRVGVTGHRIAPKLPDDALPAIRANVGRLFVELSLELTRAAHAASWAFSPEPAELVVVSALAEGADRIVAEAGLSVGAALEVVLPAARDAYEHDFKAGHSKAAYRDLLTKARSVFELDAPDGDLGEKRGYEAAGLIMLAHSDILIAIWDEGEAAGIGGTASIVEQAVSEGMPILLINPASPGQARLLWTGDMDLPPAKVRVEDLTASDVAGTLPDMVKALVDPPVDRATKAALAEFYAESPGPEHGWPLYSGLLALLAVRPLKRTDFKPRDEHPYSPDEWRKFFPGPPDRLTEAVCQTLLPAVTLPDRFAVRYGELYRSAFVFNFLAAAIAVAFALGGLSAELPWVHNRLTENGLLLIKVWLVTGEIMLLGAIFGVWMLGASRGWHRRWLDYRRAAEWLRHLRVLSLVGARTAIPRPRRTPKGTTEAGRGERLDQDDWVGWYVRAIARLLPPPGRAVDDAYVAAAQEAVITTELAAQIDYHHDNARLMESASQRLHGAGLVLFGAPALVGLWFIGAYAAYRFWGADWAFQGRFYVTALTAAFPAFGAALNAIRVQGDFETVATRSEQTAARLATIRAAMQADPLEFARLADRIQKVVAVMGAEQSEWRTLFGTRPLSLPA